MLCPQCGTEHPETANFCMACGYDLRNRSAPERPAPTEWEYVELTIPLKLKWTEGDWQGANDLIGRCEEIVRAHLREEAQEGWEPYGLTDWASMVEEGRVQRRPDRGFLPLRPSAWMYESVTVRLRRPLA